MKNLFRQLTVWRSIWLMVIVMFLVTLFTIAPQSRAVEPTLPEASFAQEVVTNLTLTASQISTQNVWISCEGSSTLGVQITQSGATASATNVTTYTFDGSINKSNIIAGYRSMAVTGNGTSEVNVFSNLSVGAIRFVRLNTINNAAAGTTPTNTTSLTAYKNAGL